MKHLKLFEEIEDKDIDYIGKYDFGHEKLKIYSYEGVVFAKRSTSDISAKGGSAWCITVPKPVDKYADTLSMYKWQNDLIFLGNTIQEVKKNIDKYIVHKIENETDKFNL